MMCKAYVLRATLCILVDKFFQRLDESAALIFNVEAQAEGENEAHL
jgi:hypothetical protein